ncbi:Ig-like domain-containing protein [Micromonospora sp. NBC_01796]|uniref:Ig-like domain-containing protein n=1 Tax=Micromonospora sp. NBC_01796 TaxID=2975987 RepID=UPI002DD8F421|nr:Ig-like domain-containing protein [Micromonospora sp. NBC_01796]WSA89579.1 Ig-like domain-containing protein [Micromonospora sp. NBC_01796]
MWRKRITVLAVAVAMALVGAAPAAIAGYQGEPLYGDLNGDGIVDRAVLTGGGPGQCGVQVALGNGSGGYGTATTHLYDNPDNEYDHCPDMGVVVDLGGDGTVELVLAWFDGRPPGVDSDLLVLRDYQPVAGFDAIYQPSYIGLADFNGDGRQDVYEWTDQGDGFLTYLNTASGQLVPGPVKWPCGWDPDYVLADFNRNGATDVVISYAGGCEYETGVVVVLDNGAVVDLEGDPVGDSYWGVAVLDANGDGIPDVRTTDVTTGEVTHFIGNGRGGFGAAPLADDDVASTKGTKKVDIPVLANDLATNAAKITIVTQPKYGKLQITSRRTVLYTPNGQHTQADRFVYRLTADGKSDVAGVTIRVKS